MLSTKPARHRRLIDSYGHPNCNLRSEMFYEPLNNGIHNHNLL